MTALTNACEGGHSGIVCVLLKAGAAAVIKNRVCLHTECVLAEPVETTMALSLQRDTIRCVIYQLLGCSGRL